MTASRMIIAAAAILLPGAASAQPDLPSRAAPNAETSIVVEGQRIRAVATDYVDRLLPSVSRLQLGRFEDPVCPMVVGLDEKIGTEIADRMREVGRATRIDVKAAPCNPTLVLLVVPDKKLAIEEFRRVRPEYLRGVSLDLLDSMAESPLPYASWQLKQAYGGDGMAIRGEGTLGPVQQPKNTLIDVLSGPALVTTVPPSRLRSNAKLHFLSAVVVIEHRALDNIDTRQLADFTLMQAMIPENARNEGPPTGSILNIFAHLPVDDEAPLSVTHADVAFLKSLRNVRSDLYASLQKSSIRQQMIDELKKAGGTRK